MIGQSVFDIIKRFKYVTVLNQSKTYRNLKNKIDV